MCGWEATSSEKHPLRFCRKIQPNLCVCVCLCVCVWTSVTKRTQEICNSAALQLIDRAKVSRMFSCILAGGPTEG